MPVLHALHGFLGHHSNWDQFQLDICSYDLYDDPLLPSDDGFWGFAKRFNAYVKEDRKILMGYSLGARLSAHALLENETKWKAAILISTDMGLRSEDEKKLRLIKDDAWAKKFELSDFDDVLPLWDSQDVFAGIKNPIKPKLNDHQKKIAVQMLRIFSKGLQQNLSERLQKLDIPILWIGGEKDEHFKIAAKNLKFQNVNSKIEIVKDVGHRLPWENPKEFELKVNQFLQEVN